mmetsp:Transcript_39744/g.84972  ORF Transcript_39744/g.84972 Transcript_39744/m.84972 type:complete len:650 (+) Transcript_39744:2521-4470(+)|eukprot:CAMPEP_0206453052 /NCGR_PEP_ID=MMETSP0324_2-20121206/20305_1 /ASSEMBLY_ACC=CAM_ASM_000836 /TAXON_ID=2866 /ORGANISM="Crypthecodinium cohnii, Strain Seligo" /LENGTH=649 /DNA_ID=CAMNT_0053923247 /DNA_START=196 /DNA_END=2145 /DNA_ORIENTATION=-
MNSSDLALPLNLPPQSFTRRGSGQRRSFNPEHARDCRVRTGTFSSVATDDSMRTLSAPRRPSCKRVLFAWLVFVPYMLILSILFFAFLIVQQVIALPFRLCGGRPLTFVLRLTGPILGSLCCLFVSVNSGEPCYGRDLRRFRTIDDFLLANSASRRKNIKRNLKKATETLRAKGIQASYHQAGTWSITREMRELLWEQCKGHFAPIYGYPAIVSCYKPMPPWMVYYVELILFLAFANDIQLFHDRNNRLVCMNTRVLIGTMYVNPSYASHPDHGRDGLYSFSNRHMVREALRLRADILNVLPSMRSAKGQLGLRPLNNRAICCCSMNPFHRTPVSPNIEADEEPAAPHVPPPVALGGKRAARKAARKAALSGESWATGAAGTSSTQMVAPPPAAAATAATSAGGATAAPPAAGSTAPPAKGPAPGGGGKRAARKRAAAAEAAAAATAAAALEEGAITTTAAEAAAPDYAAAPAQKAESGKLPADGTAPGKQPALSANGTSTVHAPPAMAPLSVQDSDPRPADLPNPPKLSRRQAKLAKKAQQQAQQRDLELGEELTDMAPRQSGDEEEEVRDVGFTLLSMDAKMATISTVATTSPPSISDATSFDMEEGRQPRTSNPDVPAAGEAAGVGGRGRGGSGGSGGGGEGDAIV